MGMSANLFDQACALVKNRSPNTKINIVRATHLQYTTLFCSVYMSTYGYESFLGSTGLHNNKVRVLGGFWFDVKRDAARKAIFGQ